MKDKLILAIVGMPGSGKSEATSYLNKKGFPTIRFGAITDEGLRNLGLPVNSENEKMFREKIRQELGMGAYAVKSKPKLDILLGNNDIVVIDGLYSWEEYIYLKKEYPNFVLINIFAEPEIRYKRLNQRAVRPVSLEDSRQRDIAEIEKLNKGGPIAIADYLIVNNGDNMEQLYKKIDELLGRLRVIG